MSHCISQLATFFIVMRSEPSIAERYTYNLFYLHVFDRPITLYLICYTGVRPESFNSLATRQINQSHLFRLLHYTRVIYFACYVGIMSHLIRLLHRHPLVTRQLDQSHLFRLFHKHLYQSHLIRLLLGHYTRVI